MKTEILNTWNSTPLKPVFYTVYNTDLKYTNGDYKIYHQYANCWLYTYKDIAINQLAGINKEHLNALATNTAPAINTPAYFLFERAKETKQKGINLLTINI